MVKKIFSIILASMLLVSALAVSAAVKEGYPVTDNFDSMTADEIAAVATNKAFDGNVWNISAARSQQVGEKASFTNASGTDKVALSIVEESGNKMLAMQMATTCNAAFTTEDVALADGETATLSFRFKFHASKGGKEWTYGLYDGSTTTRYGKTNGTSTTSLDSPTVTGSGTITKGDWYRFSIEMTPSEVTMTITKDDGTFLKSYKRTNLNLSTARFAFYSASTSTGSNDIMYIDDSVLTITTPDPVEPDEPIEPEYVDYTDDFTSATAGSALNYTSDVWEIKDANSYGFANAAADQLTSRLNAQIASEGGNQYLSLTQTGVNIGAAMKAYDYADGTLYTSFKLRMPTAMASATGDWRLGVDTASSDSNPAFLVRIQPTGFAKPNSTGTINGAATPMAYTFDAWYSVMIKSTSSSASIWIYDANGNEVYTHTINAGTLTFAKAQVGFKATGTAGQTNAVVHLDDCRVILLDGERDMTYTGASSITGVNVDWPTIDLTFSLPVPASVSGITCGSTACTATRVDYNKLRVTVGAVLAENTSYSLNIANVTGAEGNALTGTTSVSFTTGTYSGDPILVSAPTDLISAGAVAVGAKIPVGYAGSGSTTATFVVAYYDSNDMLKDTEIFTDKTITAGAADALTITEEQSGVSYAKIFTFNSIGSLQPQRAAVKVQ